MIGEEFRLARRGLCASRRRSLRRRAPPLAKPLPISAPFDRVDAHERGREIRIELAIDGRAQSGREFLRRRLRSARRRTSRSCAGLRDISSTARSAFASGQKNGLRATSSQSQRVAIDRLRAHLHQRAAHDRFCRTTNAEPFAQWRRRPRARPFRAPIGVRRRDSRARHIWPNRCSRRGPGRNLSRMSV